MGMYFNPGNSGFKTIRKGTYVDKSGLIRLINETIDTPWKLTCISRPRRFGKSYAAQMLCAYYDRSCDSSALFDDLEIAVNEEMGATYREHLNRYHVIYLDMTNILGKAGEEGLAAFIENRVTEELFAAYPDLSPGKSLDETLHYTVELTGDKFIALIDEWDAPIRERPELQKEYLHFLRTLFKSSGTTDRIFAAAYMTGILPIRKDGSQSAVSNFKEYTALKPRQFAPYMGFNEDEVQALCREHQVYFEKMKRWYDGYTFPGAESVYNPNSVMEAIRNHEFSSYWTQTSAAEALLTWIDMDEDGLQEDVARLISGEEVEVFTGGFQNDFQHFSDRNDVLTLLIHLGYLTYIDNGYGDDTGMVRIPNHEIRVEFNNMLRRAKHPRLMRLVRESDELLQKTVHGDAEAVAEAVARMHDANYAPTYYNNEQALRSVVRLAYLSSVDQYMKIEELPSGHGCADVVFVPRRRSMLPAMVIELKWNRTADSALAQIRDRHYPAVLEGFGGEIVLVGITYDEKTKEHTCTIEKLPLPPYAGE